jgi:hypothetical protein
MSVYFYEPFYHWDRFFDEALAPGSPFGLGFLLNQRQQQRLANSEGSNEVQRAFRPK